MFPLKPLKCCFSSMLRVIVLLEGEPLSESQISGRLKHVPSRITLYLEPSVIPSILTSFPVPADMEKYPHSMMLPPCFTVGIVFSGWREVFVPNIAFPWWPKSYILVWPEYLLPYVCGVSHMPFCEHQMCLLIFIFKPWLFSGCSSVKPNSAECTT